MTFEQITANLHKKIYHPIYFLSGDEAFFIDEICDFISKNVLTDAEKEFNQIVLYGKDIDATGIMNEARRYPMMANYYVVIVKEAQHIKNIENIQSYVENPMKSTILVICYRDKKLDKRKKVAKLIEEKGVLYESKKLYENQIPAWIEKYIKSKGYKIGMRATALLSNCLGNDLSRIVNELNKIMIIVPANSEITEQVIEDNIGISKDFNSFELIAALGKRDVMKANQIIQYFASNPKENPAIATLIVLFNFFTQLLMYHNTDDKSPNNVAAVLELKHVFFVNEFKSAAKNYNIAQTIKAIGLLREYDGKLKGVDNISASETALMQELVYKIIH